MDMQSLRKHVEKLLSGAKVQEGEATEDVDGAYFSGKVSAFDAVLMLIGDEEKGA